MSLTLKQLGNQFAKDHEILQSWPELDQWQDIDVPETDIDKGWQQLIKDLFHFSVDHIQLEEKSDLESFLDQSKFNSKSSNTSITEVERRQGTDQFAGIQTQENRNKKAFIENQLEDSFSQPFKPTAKKQSLKGGLDLFAQDFSKQIHNQSPQLENRTLNSQSHIYSFSEQQTKKEQSSTDLKNSFQATEYEHSELTKKTIQKVENCNPIIEKNTVVEKSSPSEISCNKKEADTFTTHHNDRKEIAANTEILESRYNQVQDSEKIFSSSLKKQRTGLMGFAGDFNTHQESISIKTINKPVGKSSNNQFHLQQEVKKTAVQMPEYLSPSLLSISEGQKDIPPTDNSPNYSGIDTSEDQKQTGATFQPYVHQQSEKITHSSSPEVLQKNLDLPQQTSADSEEQFMPLSMRFSSSIEKNRPVNETDLKRQFRRFYRR